MKQPATKESQCENGSESKLSNGVLVSDRLWDESTVCEVSLKISDGSKLNVEDNLVLLI